MSTDYEHLAEKIKEIRAHAGAPNYIRVNRPLLIMRPKPFLYGLYPRFAKMKWLKSRRHFLEILTVEWECDAETLVDLHRADETDHRKPTMEDILNRDVLKPNG